MSYRSQPCSAGSFYRAVRTDRKGTGRARPNRESERTDRAGRSGKHTFSLGRFHVRLILGRPNRTIGTKIYRPSANFSRPRYPMARQKEVRYEEEEDPFMQPPRNKSS
ncbi:unnamed protein product [Microthlaspi erraticum]|uniref:Uncharacterized protein n=1 Tax=Microthlaspi erraticum TaxID=1685480 RepID=A0A6D2JW69_9BRAS|nr:unnamed protein product [Microthlaspi erraticum]